MPYTKIIQSGSLLEVYEYEKAPVPFSKRKAYRPRKRDTRNLLTFNRRSNNVRSRKKHFERIIYSNLRGDEKPSFITFTMYQVFGIEDSYKHFTDFIHRLRRRYGKGFKYVGVPEFQKRGAVHFHVLFWGLPTSLIHEERSTRNLQRIWSWGFVDCILTDGSPKLARYLSKYMSKALQDSRLLDQQAYTCSRNIMRPVSISSALPLAYENEIGAVDTALVYSKTFDTMWLGKGSLKIYRI